LEALAQQEKLAHKVFKVLQALLALAVSQATLVPLEQQAHKVTTVLLEQQASQVLAVLLEVLATLERQDYKDFKAVTEQLV
jgi:hypothetical protein